MLDVLRPAPPALDPDDLDALLLREHVVDEVAAGEAGHQAEATRRGETLAPSAARRGEAEAPAGARLLRAPAVSRRGGKLLADQLAVHGTDGPTKVLGTGFLRIARGEVEP